MPYDIPFAPHNTLSSVRSRTQPTPYPQSRNAHLSTDETASTRAEQVRPIEPILLVHQQQVETFRLIAAALGRGLKALARPYSA
jgi:hypothetical protein